MVSAELADRVVLVTGASGGIGSAVARALASRGACVVLSGRDEAALERAREAAGGDSTRLACIPADLLEAGAPRRLVEAAAAWRGRLDGLVSCAGGARFTFFTRLDEEDHAAGLRLNFTAVVDLVRAALPHLVRSPRGRIVLVNSIAAREPPPPRGSAYLPAKAALLHFAEGLFSEIRDSGVSVSSILPDLVDTPLVPAALGYDAATLLRPESVAEAVLYAMSSGADACVTEVHLRNQPSRRRRDAAAGGD